MKSESDGSSFSIEYEVFLSFRGSDVRQTFADCLHSCLVRSKIRTFRDEEKLRKGENIGASLIQAITESKIYIPILTQNYASSKWCLQELAKMVDCWKTGGGKEQHIILPVFYFVDPRDVRHHDSGPYKEAFEQHCLKHDPQTVLEWKEALQEVGQMKGWHVTESDGQGAVIDKIFAEVESHLRASYALVTDELVGIDFHVEEVMRLLSLDSHSASEKIVGIHGMGGLGKTTLAKAVYNKVSMQFDHCCFLENIRETLSKNDGELTLQNRIISEILPSDSKPARDVSDGIRIIRERVRRYRLLIVLDDVDERFQFQNIFGKLGDFSMDSRFLITTRDARVLELLQECKVYATEGMSYDHALKLFSKHALGTDCPSEGYASLSEEFVKVAAGLPLALKVIGSLLFHTDKGYWEAKLTELKKIPPAKVQERLKISYDELTHNEKQVFLDVACLFVGVNKDAPIYMWSDCDFYPASTVRTLVQRSLIRINEKDQFWMHDHVRDLGRAIVCEENNQNPYKRSRIWSNRDAINMLKSREGTDCVEVLRVDMKGEDFVLTVKEFKQFSRLRYLEVLNGRLAGNFKGILPCIRWLRLYRCKSFPTGLNLQKMAVLNLEDCSVRDDWSGWNEIKAASKLKAVNLSLCRDLEQVPDLSNCRGLELLDFYGCQKMQGELDIGNWENLRVLAVNCTLITKLKGEIKLLQNLRKINAKTLALSSSYIPALPSSLKTLDLSLSRDLHTLPSLSNLTTLTVLRLHCVGIHEIPGLGDLKLLATLDIVSSSNLGNLDGLENLVLLEELIVETCDRLKTLPSLASLTKLHKLQIKSCWALKEVHGVGELRESLSHLDMRGRLTLTGIDALHSIKKLETLSLMALEFTRTSLTSSLISLSMFTKLRRLTIIHESYLSDRQQSSKSSLKQFPHLSSMKNLRELAIIYCVDLVKVAGLDTLESLEGLVKLKEINFSGCTLLTEVKGLGRLESLEVICMNFCESIQELPNLSGMKSLRTLDVWKCRRLKEVNGLEAASKLKAVNLSSCRYLEQVPDLSNCRGLELLDFYGCQEMQGELDIGNWENLRVLAVNCTLITKLKGEIKLLRNLRKINASHSGLVEMPAGISKLSSLEALNLVSFNPNMPDFTEMLPNGLKTLALSSSYIPALPSSLKTLDLSLSKDLHTLPSLSNLTTLTVLRLHCVGIHEIPGLGDLKLLATLDIVGASNLGNLAGLENLVLLEELIVENCDRLKTLPSLASLTKLHKLQIKSCWALNEVHGVGRLRESLSHLDMSGRLTLTGIDALHSMKKLETLSLMALEFTRRSVTSSLTSLSMFTKLRRLTIIHESYLSDRQQSSKSSLKQFPHLSSMKNLRELAIFYCVDLVKVAGLDTLESLEVLDMKGCKSISKLPDLSGLVKLKEINFTGCTLLTEVRGLGRLESLEVLYMPFCESIKELPNLSGMKSLRRLDVWNCRLLKEVNGLEGLESLEYFDSDKRVKAKYLLKRVSRYTKRSMTRSVLGALFIKD
ncbi:Disease resistance protein L6 [Linum perenne]